MGMNKDYTNSYTCINQIKEEWGRAIFQTSVVFLEERPSSSNLQVLLKLFLCFLVHDIMVYNLYRRYDL